MDLDQVLKAVLCNDGQIIKQAEDHLNQAAKQPQIIPELLARLQGSQDSAVRQLCAVLLRKKISRHWTKLPEEAKQQTKAVLLQQLVVEPAHYVRKSVAYVVAVVARHTVPDNQWNELLAFLQQCSQSSNHEHREVAFILFDSLIDRIGKSLQPHVVPLMQIVVGGLQDPELSVRLAALAAVEPLPRMIRSDAELAQFHHLVTTMLQAAQLGLAAGDDDTVVLTSQILIGLVEVQAPLLQPALPAVVAFSMEAAMKRDLDMETRQQALQVLHWVSRHKPKQLGKHKLVQSVVEALCAMSCEPPQEGEEEETQDEAEGELGPDPAYRLASLALNAVAINCSSKEVAPPVLSFAQSGAASPDPHVRRGAMIVLAVIAEGCRELLRKKLAVLLPIVLAGTRDPDKIVRSKAALAIGQMSDFLQPDIVDHYQTVLPAVFHMLDDPAPDVQEMGCYALDAFVENLGPAVQPYLGSLVEKLLAVLRNGRAAVQEMALSALAAAACSGGREIREYAGALLPALQHFMTATANEALRCRCRATECAGLLVEALHADDVRGMVPGLMELALQGFRLDYHELREATHGLFASIARVMKDEFSPYLTSVVPLALECCEQDDGTWGGDEGDESEDLDALSTDSSEDDEADHERMVSIRTGVTDEKSAAVAALGFYAEGTGPAFQPYMQSTLDCLATHSHYFHPQVREAAYEAMSQLAGCVARVFPAAEGQAASPQLHEALAIVLPKLVQAAQKDDEKTSVATALGALASMLQLLGPAAFGSALQSLSDAAALVLDGQAPCQLEDDEEEDVAPQHEGEEEEGDEDEDLLNAAGEAVQALAEQLGAQAYAPVFEASHFRPLLHRLRASQPDGMRSLALGALSEVAKVLMAGMVPYVDHLMPPLLRELRTDDALNRQNAAFCVGLLVEGCPEKTAPFLLNTLQALQPLFAADEAASTRDNAAGAVARMLLVAGGALPLEAVVPVWLGALPLQEDFEEAEPIFGAMAALLAGDQAPRVASCVPDMVRHMGAAAVHDIIKPEVKRLIAATLAQLQASYPQQAGPLLAALPEDQRAALQHHAQG